MPIVPINCDRIVKLLRLISELQKLKNLCFEIVLLSLLFELFVFLTDRICPIPTPAWKVFSSRLCGGMEVNVCSIFGLCGIQQTTKPFPIFHAENT